MFKQVFCDVQLDGKLHWLGIKGFIKDVDARIQALYATL
jgi:hypothetical protein